MRQWQAEAKGFVGRPQIDLDEARKFCAWLDPNNEGLTFQTFDDEKKSKRPELSRVFHGTFEQHAPELARLNAQGAGVFVATNQTDLSGRSKDNVVAVRKFFVDTDGAPLQPILTAAKDAGIKPSCIVESSPGNYHVHWNARECALGDFSSVQAALAERFGTDKAVKDLPRVMRVAGFLHQKRENGSYKTGGPSRSRTRCLKPDAGAYTSQQMFAWLGVARSTDVPSVAAASSATNDDLGAGIPALLPPPETPENVARAKLMLSAVPADCDREKWLHVIWATASTGWACSKELAREWSMTAQNKYNEADFNRDWGSFDPTRGIGFGTLVHHAKQHGWVDVMPAGTEVEHLTGNGGDVWNGKAYATMHRGKQKFVHETGDLLAFDAEKGYVHAPPGEADRAAKEVLRWMRGRAAEAYKEAPDAPKTKRIMAHVERTSKAPNLRAMIEMAKSEEGMTCSLSEFDADPMQLGVANGVLDLRTQTLLPVSPSLLVTKRSPVAYDPYAECPTFLNYLGVVQPKEEMQVFLQRRLGIA